LRLLDAGRTARTGADPNLIVGGAVIGEAPAGAVEPLTEEAAVAGIGMLDAAAVVGGVGMLDAAPAAVFVVLGASGFDGMATLFDEHGDLAVPPFIGRICKGEADSCRRKPRNNVQITFIQNVPYISNQYFIMILIIQQSIQS
jgi:hypothetical protein